MNSGNFSIFIARSLATRSALRSYGIRTSIVNLVVRSTRVATCDAFAFPMIKSPSQKPRHRPILGLRRPLADVHHVPDLPLTARGTRPVDTLSSSLPQRQLQLGPQLTAGRQVQRLIDRLVGHPHLRIVGMSHHEPGTDLLRRPIPGQSTVHLVMQPPGRHELVLPGSRTQRITTILRTNNPIRISTAIPLDLPRNRRMMATRHPPDITRRIPLRDTSGNQLPLLNNPCRKSAHRTPCPSVDETLETYQGVAMTV